MKGGPLYGRPDVQGLLLATLRAKCTCVCPTGPPGPPPALHILHRPDLLLLLCQHWQAYQPPFWQEQLLRRGSHDEWESPCSQCCWRWVTSSRPFGPGRSASNADSIWFGLGIRSKCAHLIGKIYFMALQIYFLLPFSSSLTFEKFLIWFHTNMKNCKEHELPRNESCCQSDVEFNSWSKASSWCQTFAKTIAIVSCRSQ